jgi:hypothetical protein
VAGEDKENVVVRAFSPREKVPEGRMRDTAAEESLTRPLATLSRWERDRAKAVVYLFSIHAPSRM